MTIAPLRFEVAVKTAPARTFDLFTRDFGVWWPKGKTIGAKPHVAVVLEPHPGGRWYERDEDGTECDWGKVLEWDPPGRLLLGWQLNAAFKHDPDLVTEVELTFAPTEGGGTLVTLEHRDLHRFGDAAERMASQLKGGWPTFVQAFGAYANQETSQ